MSLKSIWSHLQGYSESQTEVEKDNIENEIWEKFGTNGAVFILDMAGFSRTTVSKGLVYYLSKVQRMQIVVDPILSNNGCLVKYDADNAFAFFQTTEQAVEAAIKINLAVQHENTTNTKEMEISVSIGIDYGKFLYFPEANDFYGSPVNFACKLGEDIGRGGEILVAENAWNSMSNHSFSGKLSAYQVSGIAFKAYSLIY